MRNRRTQHPALALMRHAARGHLTRFQTDLDVHDAAALATHRHTDSFAWVCHNAATWITFMGESRRLVPFAGTFIGAYGAEHCRFYFWDGSVFATYKSASALDERIREYEDTLRERARAGELADRGIA